MGYSLDILWMKVDYILDATIYTQLGMVLFYIWIYISFKVVGWLFKVGRFVFLSRIYLKCSKDNSKVGKGKGCTVHHNTKKNKPMMISKL